MTFTIDDRPDTEIDIDSIARSNSEILKSATTLDAFNIIALLKPFEHYASYDGYVLAMRDAIQKTMGDR